MRKEIYNVEGMEIEIEIIDETDNNSRRSRIACMFKAVREQSGMSRKEFSDWLGIPYRTMQEWELGRRAMPEYLLRLIAYKVINEREKKKEI